MRSNGTIDGKQRALMQVSREPMTVMFTDVVGFTTLMERSETEALHVLKTIRDVQLPLLQTHEGRLVKEMGDGTLCTFRAPVDAVRCARGIQGKLGERDFRVRIGIHWGEVLLKDDDVLGDPVNVASRIQELAPPGGVCVSGELLRNYGPGRRPGTRPMGLQQLKGLGRLVDLFAIRGTSGSPMPVRSPRIDSLTERAVVTAELPSITVMPLVNLGPRDDDFYAYSISADLVRDIARAGRISVTPLSDVLRLEKVVGSNEGVAERLNSQFLVRGTLWRKKERFQLSIELHDIRKGRLAWTDNWIDDWYDLPAIKGKMADGLLKVLGVEPCDLHGITGSETTRSGAYENYLKAGEFYRNRRGPTDVDKSLELLRKALEYDPLLVPARILLGMVHSESGEYGKAEEALEKACDMALEKGDRAGHLNALNWTGINLWRQSRYREARITFLRTLRLAKVLDDVTGEARSLSNIGLMDSNLGNYGRALKYLERALEASGTDDVSSLRANTLCNIGLTHWHMGDNKLALNYYKRAIALYKVLEDRAGQAYIMRNIGIIKRSMGHCGEAMELTVRASRIYRDLGDRLGLCHSLNSLGNIHMHLGQYEKALKDYRDALEIADAMDDMMTMGILKTNLGSISAEMQNYDEALRFHTEAMNISIRLEDPVGEAENLSLIGLDNNYLGRPEEARKALEGAIELMEEMGAGARTALVRANLAAVLLDMGRKGEPGRLALEHMETMESILTPGTSERTVILWKLSKLYGLLADDMHGTEGRRLRKKSTLYLREAHRSLIEIADSLSDTASRRSYLDNIRDHRDILYAFLKLEDKTPE